MAVEPDRWDHIRLLLEVLERGQPRRVLEVGVGSGRLGLLIRSAGDLWSGGHNGDPPAFRLVGLELPGSCAHALARAAYDELRTAGGDPLGEQLGGPWDLLVLGFGTSLASLPRSEVIALLERGLTVAGYVYVVLPIGGALPDEPCDGHQRSFWEPDDVLAFPLVYRTTCTGDGGRPVEAAILSNYDRYNLGAALAAGEEEAGGGLSDDLRRLVQRIDELAAELRYIKGHSTYRLGRAIRSSGLWNLLRWLRNRNRRVVTVQALGRRSPDSGNCEVWLLGACPNAGESCVPWDFLERDAGWQEHRSEEMPFGRCYISTSGRQRIPVADDPELRFLRHAWSGQVVVRFRGRSEVIDLYAPRPEVLRVYPARTPMVPPHEDAGQRPLRLPHIASAASAPSTRFTQADEEFIEAARRSGARVAAVHVPRWIGVTASTRALFDTLYAVPESPEEEPTDFSPSRLERHARALCEAGVEQVIFSGGDEMHWRLMRELRRLKPSVRVKLLWHGPYVFFAKDYDWRVLTLWLDSARCGEVELIGTVKKGMEEFFRTAGVPSKLVLNYLPHEPQPASPVQGDGSRIGMWMLDNHWKSPHAMLAAIRMVPGARLCAAGLGVRAREVIERFGIPVERFSHGPLPRDELPEAMRQTHLTLYVTFFECCPMLPLESFSVGVPCLIGPSSHLFEDDPGLARVLVVPYPDRADVIARSIRAVLEQRDAIVAQYNRYIPTYNERARRCVQEFLD